MPIRLVPWLCLLLIGFGQSGCRPSSPTIAPVTAEAPATATVLPTALATPLPAQDTAESSTGEQNNPTELLAEPQWYTYQIIATYPHDANAFTQGLLFDNKTLYEGTGLYGESTLRRVDLESGNVEQSITLPAQFFGEGVTIVGNRIFQLTWREQTGFIYDKATFEQLNEFHYQTEGWGLTYDGTHIILSDGSEYLYFLEPDSQIVVNRVAVTMVDPAEQIRKAVVRLNELEYIDGEVYANVWQTNYIVRIDPATGYVTGVVDLTGLLPDTDRVRGTDVLNGIAYLPEENRLFVTGKKWPTLFEIELVPIQQ